MYELENINPNNYIENNNNTNFYSKNAQNIEQKKEKFLSKFYKLEQDVLSLIN